MPRLIGDIGGTNARFALVDENGLSSEARTLQVADHPGLVAGPTHEIRRLNLDELSG
jgi:glucokinase